MADGAPLVHEGWAAYERRRDAWAATATRSATPPSSRATPRRRWRRPTPSSRAATSPTLAGRADRAARDHRAVAGRQGHRLVLDAGAVRGALGRRARRSQIPESHVRIDRAAARRRLRLQVRLPLRGHVAALARAARRPVKLVFSRHEEFIAPDHRREGMVIELETGVKQRRHHRRPPRQAGPRQRRVLRRGRLLRPDGRDARVRPVQAPERRRRLVPGLHEQPAVELDPRPHGAAGLLGASSSTWTRSPRPSAWTRSSCAAAR